MIPSAHAQTPRRSADAKEPLATRGIVVDPADYLKGEKDAGRLADKLIPQLKRNGVNTLYLNAYNVEYGAYYKTDHPFNHESSYGRQDLLKRFIERAHASGIAVYAAVYDHQHRGAWEANPSWRSKTRSGGDYTPQGTDVEHFLSIGHPSVHKWWMGFLQDLLTNYPELDGIELREPIINWWGTSADFNPAVRRSFNARYPNEPVGGETWRRFRQQLLTTWLHDEIDLVHRAGRKVEVTTVASALRDGHLMTASAQAWETGFDLDGLLKGTVLPDAIKVEIIWQQWAAVYGYVTFTPEWTKDALEEFMEQVRGRVPVITHIELTDFGSRPMTLDEFRRALDGARTQGVVGVDVYSAALADSKAAWGTLRSGFAGRSLPASEDGVRHALVLYDGKLGELTRIGATNIVNLLGHFDVSWRLQPVEEYAAKDLAAYDYVFYEGAAYGNAPDVFLKDAARFKGTIVWIGRNLFQLEDAGRVVPVSQDTQDTVEVTGPVRYRGEVMDARGDLLPAQAEEGARVVAQARVDSHWQPYMIRADRFWYVAGPPADYIDDPNGRYYAFADALHDMLGIRGSAPQRAFVRIEDVNPLTDPQALRSLADTFAKHDQPFLIAVFPFYVDPAKRLHVSLSEQPEAVRALKYMVSRGGSLVLHGSSHQHDGLSGLDWEFWNPKTVSGVEEDGPEYVAKKLDDALEEMWRNDLHPMAWETPHYGATPFDYSTFATYFSTFVERRTYGVWKGSDYQQAFPYQIESDIFGGRIIPENLGYVREEADAERILKGAKALRSVRSAIAGAFIHPTVSTETLNRILDGYERLGYAPFDLSDIPNTVRTAQRVETTGRDPVELPVPSGAVLEERVLDRNGREREMTSSRVLSYERVKREFKPEHPGDILSLAVNPAARLHGGFFGFARAVGERVDDTAALFGLMSILLLLLAYARLKIAGPVPAIQPARTPSFFPSAIGVRVGGGELHREPPLEPDRGEPGSLVNPMVLLGVLAAAIVSGILRRARGGFS